MFFKTREKIAIDGIMPERALLRLKRAHIALYNVQKPQKNRIVFCIDAKDSPKVFAIYPKVCYNNSGYTPYSARSLGLYGVGALVEKAKKRLGFVLGVLLFCGVSVAADSFVFGVDFVGTDVYRREVLAALEKRGIKPFSVYKSGEEDLVCSEILSLSGVEYCSVKKLGLRVVVEIRTSPFQTQTALQGEMLSKHSGTVLSIVAIKGTPLKKIGDTVRVGEPLVGDYFITQDGGQVRVEIIARAHIACVYEAEIPAQTAEEAFAAAYLESGISSEDTVTERKVEQTQNGYFVRLAYTALQRMNV